MAGIHLTRQQTEAYVRVAHRQLAMAKALFDKELYEGVVFHCYHAFEAACSAGIAHHGRKVPHRHRDKFNAFRRLYPAMPFAAEFAALLTELYPERGRSLYADLEFGRVIDPTVSYSRLIASEILARTRGMVSKIESLLQ